MTPAPDYSAFGRGIRWAALFSALFFAGLVLVGCMAGALTRT